MPQTKLEEARDDLLYAIGGTLTGNSKIKLCTALDAFRKAREVKSPPVNPMCDTCYHHDCVWSRSENITQHEHSGCRYGTGNGSYIPKVAFHSLDQPKSIPCDGKAE